MYSEVLQSPATLAVRGILAILFGLVAVLLPVSAFLGLVIAFGAYAFVDGIFALTSAITRRDRGGRGWLVVEGIAGLIAGIITFVAPAATSAALVAVFAAWALVTGIMKIVLAIRLRKEISHEWLLVLSGVASIVVAGLVITTPVTATLALVWTLGIWAIVMGAMLLGLSFKVRKWERSVSEPPLERAA